MSVDISKILKDWPYEPGQITVRKVRGADGLEKIQLRLDLGLLQMNTTGRPDGDRPHGCKSLLDYYEQQLQVYKSAHGSEEGFELDENACERLRGEAVMYYHRYLAEFVLEDFASVERDTERNLRLLDFLSAHAAEESDRCALDQYRPYMIMMNTRARGKLAIRDKRLQAALTIVKLGIERIREFYKRFGREEIIAKSGEIAVLKAFVGEIEGHIPLDPLEKLKKDLEKAIGEERYEDAADLRDRMHKLVANAPSPEAHAENKK